jgi:hypothetical protein
MSTRYWSIAMRANVTPTFAQKFAASPETIAAAALHGKKPLPGRIPAPATDKVVWQNGVWVIRDTITGRAYGPFRFRRQADEALAAGRMPEARPVARRVR